MLTTAEWEAVRLSLQVSAAAVAIVAPFGIVLAYLLARGRVPLGYAVDNLIQIPLVLPPVVTGWLLLVAFSPAGPLGGWLENVLGVRVVFSWIGAAIASGVVAFPLMVQTMRVAFEQVDPAWEEAGYIDGGTKWAVFQHVTIPLAARGILAGLVLAFGRALGEFGATIVLAGNIPGETRTIPLAIFTQINRIDGGAAVFRLVLIAIALSALSLLAHAFLRRRLSGHPETRRNLRR